MSEKRKRQNVSRLIIIVSLFFCFPVVTDVELKRLKDAFKRTSGPNYYMTQQCFYREVLGDGVPHKVAEVSHIIHYVPLTTNTVLVQGNIN